VSEELSGCDGLALDTPRDTSEYTVGVGEPPPEPVALAAFRAAAARVKAAEAEMRAASQEFGAAIKALSEEVTKT